MGYGRAIASDKPGRSSATGQKTPAPVRRRSRSREETRTIVLSAAARVAVARVSGDGADTKAHNPLASVRITDALAEVNQTRAAQGLAPMTTGAVYHIWDGQSEFQRDLLTWVMNRISTPGAQQIEQRAHQMMEDGLPVDDIFRMISDDGFDASRAAPELFLGLGLGALSSPDLVRAAQESATAAYVDTVKRLLSTLLDYGGRRLRSGHTMADLIWATEALAWGYLLRWRTHPEIATSTDSQGRSSRSSAYLGVIDAFTEPQPTSAP